MSGVKRLILVLTSLFLAILFVLPTLVFFIGTILAVYGKWVSGFFCLVFAWNIAKYVESKYERYLAQKEHTNSETEDDAETAGYTYSVGSDGRISFTFRITDHDGRQLSRLKFMREKFFEDK